MRAAISWVCIALLLAAAAMPAVVRAEEEAEVHPKGTTSTSAQHEEKEHPLLARFTDWLADNGVDTSYVKVRSTPDMGLTLVAARPIPEGTTVLNVSRAVVINNTMALEHPVVSRILEETQNVLPHLKDLSLMMMLIYEKYYNASSFWAPWFALVPDSYDGMWDTWNTTEVALLALHRPGYMHYQKRREAMQMAQKLIRHGMFLRHPEIFGTEDKMGGDWYMQIRWAFFTVSTRSFDVRPDVEGPVTRVLIPMIDFMNHVNNMPNMETDWDNSTARGFVYIADHDVEKNEQLFLSYDVDTSVNARMCGFDFLVSYGFITADPVNDCAYIAVTKTREAGFDTTRWAMLIQENLFTLEDISGGDITSLEVIRSDGVVPENIWKILRIAQLMPHEYVRASKGVDTPISLMNELSAVRNLVETMKMLRLQIAQSIAKLQQEGVLPPDPRDWSRLAQRIVSLVSGEDQVLMKGINIVEKHWLGFISSKYHEVPEFQSTQGIQL